MRITKLFVNYFLLASSFLFSESSPINPFNLSQPNGYSFQVRMFGSEYFNYIQTLKITDFSQSGSGKNKSKTKSKAKSKKPTKSKKIKNNLIKNF